MADPTLIPDGPPDSGDGDALTALVERGLAQLEDGATLDVEHLCREHPELAPAVVEALGLQDDLPELCRRAADDPLIGALLQGRYRLEERVGAGAMGTVYRAFDRDLKRIVAVKVLRTDLGVRSVREQRFLREAEALASLRHPHVVAIHDRGSAPDGTAFLVMDYLQGASLATILERCATLADRDGLPAAYAGTAWLDPLLGPGIATESSFLRQAVRWTAEIASALAALHSAGVLHRDVKPSNIFVTRDRRAVLLDFGLAKRPEDLTATMPGSPVGTPCYMAPEQLEGQAELGPSADVYGLAATLYHAITRKPPYQGESSMLLLSMVRDDPAPAVRDYPNLPRDLSAVLDTGLERRPSRRYADANALDRDLTAFLEHRQVSVRPLTTVGRWWRAARRRPLRTVSVVSTALAVAALGIALPLWLDATARINAEEWGELNKRLPTQLAIEGDPEQRLLVPGAERNGYIATLDRMLELKPEELPIRLLRAALYLDRNMAGDRGRAAADLAAISAAGGSAYLREVAQRYATAGDAEGRGGTKAVDLDDLEHTPETPQECFVAGFHELRNRHRSGFAQRSLTLLDRAAEAYVPARDLRLIALLATGNFDPALEEAAYLEGHYGSETSRTRFAMGVAHLVRRDLQKAIGCFETCAALRPGRHGPIHNLGVAYHRLGDLDRARDHFEQALELRPWFWNSRYHLAELTAEAGDFETARQLVEAIEPVALGAERWKHGYLLGSIELKRALAAHGDGDKDTVEAASTAAVEWFRRTRRVTPASRRGTVQLSREVAEALLIGDLQEVVARRLRLLRADPTNPYQIANLRALLPGAGGLSAAAAEALGEYLQALVETLAPNFARPTDAK
ncbi:MAG: serine/threonine-protein kinase [Planctomycetota bacterium]